MGKTVRCPECGAMYRDLEELEDLRDNDSICLRCNAPIEIADWDWLLSTWEDDPDLDDVEDSSDEDDWSGDDGIDIDDDDDDIDADPIDDLADDDDDPDDDERD